MMLMTMTMMMMMVVMMMMTDDDDDDEDGDDDDDAGDDDDVAADDDDDDDDGDDDDDDDRDRDGSLQILHVKTNILFAVEKCRRRRVKQPCLHECLLFDSCLIVSRNRLNDFPK